MKFIVQLRFQGFVFHNSLLNHHSMMHHWRNYLLIRTVSQNCSNLFVWNCDTSTQPWKMQNRLVVLDPTVYYNYSCLLFIISKDTGNGFERVKRAQLSILAVTRKRCREAFNVTELRQANLDCIWMRSHLSARSLLSISAQLHWDQWPLIGDIGTSTTP